MTADLTHRRIPPGSGGRRRPGLPHRHRRHLGLGDPVDPGTALTRAPQPAHPGRPLQRCLPVPHRTAHRARLRARAGAAGDLRRRARLGDPRARPSSRRRCTTSCGRQAPTSATATRAWLRCRACGWRRATATSATTSTTRTTRTRSGSASPSRWTSPDGFIGQDALVAFRANGPAERRLASFLLDDPAYDLMGGEPIYANDKLVGYLRAGAFGYTLGASVGLGSSRAGADSIPARSGPPASRSTSRARESAPGPPCGRSTTPTGYAPTPEARPAVDAARALL